MAVWPMAWRRWSRPFGPNRSLLPFPSLSSSGLSLGGAVPWPN